MPPTSKTSSPDREEFTPVASPSAPRARPEESDGNGTRTESELPAAVDRRRDELEPQLRSVETPRVNERIFSSAFQQAPIAMALVDPSGRPFHVNRALCGMLGYSEAELLSENVTRMIHPDDVMRTREQLGPVLCREIDIVQAETRYVHKDGSVVHVLLSACLVGPTGDPSNHLVFQLQDVTDRIRSENELRQREARLQLLTDHMPAIVWTFDRDLRLTSVRGGRPLQLLEGTAADFVGRTVMEIFGIENRQTHPIPLFDRALEGEAVNFETDWNGRRFQVHIDPFRHAGTDEAECIGVSLDVTEKKLAEEALRESERRYRAIVEEQMELVCRWKPDTTLTFVNREYASILGKEPEELIGVPLLSLVPEEDRDDVDRHLAELIARVTPERPSPLQMYEQRVVDANQQATFWQWTERGIFDEHGRLLEVQSVGRNVTALKQAETRIRQHQAQLAQVGRARTLGETAAGLAHELNQPLAAVINFTRGCIHRLRSGQSSNDALIEAMGQVVTQAERAAEIVRGLRRFISNTDALRIWTPVNAFVEESLPYVETEARRYGVRVRTLLAPQAPRVQIDRSQLEQVLLNLVRNGAEAMGEAGGDLTIVTKANGDGEVEVAVRDAGVGISAADAARMFEPFFTTKRDGLGIGLTLSRSIIEAHGGRLWATANPEGGTTFHFTLPGSSGGETQHG